MPRISFIDDNGRLGKATVEKNFGIIYDEVISHNHTFEIKKNDMLVAANISKNNSLSELYEDVFYVVKFELGNVDTFHNKLQYDCFVELFKQIDGYMGENFGYYNIRIPNHIVDCIRAYNEVIKGGIFCGGTTEMLSWDKKANIETNLYVFLADSEYIKKNVDRLLEIAYESFKEFQGQYHISPVTYEKAGKVYENWLAQSLYDYKDNVIVSELNGEIAGFIMIGENEWAIDIVLGAVEKAYRKNKAYRIMSGYAMNLAYSKKKLLTASTQLDNFAAQNSWLPLGLKPFYAVFNFHIDKRRRK